MLESGLDQSPAGAVSANRKSVEVLENRIKPPNYGTAQRVLQNVPREQFETPGPAMASARRFPGASFEGFV